MVTIKIHQMNDHECRFPIFGYGEQPSIRGQRGVAWSQTPSRTRALAIRRPSPKTALIPCKGREAIAEKSSGTTACQLKAGILMDPTSPMPLSKTSSERTTSSGFGEVESLNTTAHVPGSRRSKATPRSSAISLPHKINNRRRDRNKGRARNGSLKPSEA